MGHWDAVVSDFQGVDVNRVVRNGIDIMEREPDAWRAKILILAAAYPGVDWSQVFLFVNCRIVRTAVVVGGVLQRCAGGLGCREARWACMCRLPVHWLLG